MIKHTQNHWHLGRYYLVKSCNKIKQKYAKRPDYFLTGPSPDCPGVQNIQACRPQGTRHVVMLCLAIREDETNHSKNKQRNKETKKQTKTLNTHTHTM